MKNTTAHVATEHLATMAATVRRFTGRYECGCQVDPEVLQPTECKFHHKPAIYHLEELEVTNVEIGPGIDEFLKEV